MIHIVLTPKCRKLVLKKTLAETIKESFYKCANTHKWHIERLDIHTDYAHLVVGLDPDVSICDMIKAFKEKSNKAIALTDQADQVLLFSDDFWQEGFFTATEGAYNADKVREYLASHEPNKKTKKAILDAQNKKVLQHALSTKELFEKLDQ